MIELPRAALRADAIAEAAEFFSFGTNDLTQTTFGISRDDAASFLDDLSPQGHHRAGSVRLARCRRRRRTGRASPPSAAGRRGPTSSSASAANMAATRPRSASARRSGSTMSPARPSACRSPGSRRRRRRSRCRPDGRPKDDRGEGKPWRAASNSAPAACAASPSTRERRDLPALHGGLIGHLGPQGASRPVASCWSAGICGPAARYRGARSLMPRSEPARRRRLRGAADSGPGARGTDVRHAGDHGHRQPHPGRSQRAEILHGQGEINKADEAGILARWRVRPPGSGGDAGPAASVDAGRARRLSRRSAAFGAGRACAACASASTQHSFGGARLLS